MIIKELIQALKDNGYNPVFIKSSDPQLEDDSIKVSDTIDIQLCQDGTAGVSQQLKDGTFMCYLPTKSINKILFDIQDCLKTEGQHKQVKKEDVSFDVFVPEKGKMAKKMPNIFAPTEEKAKWRARHLYGNNVIVVPPYNP